MPTVLVAILGLIGLVLLIVAAVFVMVPLIRGIGWLIVNFFRAIGFLVVHVWRFVSGMVTDTMRFVGALLTGLIFVPLVLANVVVGRWSAATHFARGFQGELATGGRCLYRVAVGHPLRFLFLGGLTEGIEQRVPAAIAKAPGADSPSKRTGRFDGYVIVGSLKGGGSGARLYVAEPDARKRAEFERAGRDDIDQVVIKSFSAREGSSLPQIVRESRALEAARKIGLVLDHELTDERFFYVMPYVPGEDLTTVTQRLHADSEAGGLGERELRRAVGYVGDLLETLDLYHRGGLWHKDVKPDNIIVSGDTAHVVDLGLTTPLRSAMTLTTHGTEAGGVRARGA